MTDQITRAEERLLADAENALNALAPADRKHRAYYEGRQTLQHLGLALPPACARSRPSSTGRASWSTH